MNSLLLSLLLFCPAADTLQTTGYHCWSYAVSLDWSAPQQCPPGLCWYTLPHIWVDIGCTVSEAGGWMDVPDPLPGEMIMFSAEPNDVPGTFYCSPGGCAGIWWNVTADLAAPCVCPNGEC